MFSIGVTGGLSLVLAAPAVAGSSTLAFCGKEFTK